MKSTRRVMPDRKAKKKVCKLAEEAAATRRVMLDRPEKKWEKFVFSDYHEGKPWMPPSEQIKELESNDQRVPYLCEHCFGIISYYQQIREELLPEEGRSGCFRCKGVFPHYITMRIELRHFKICKTCAQRKKLCQACMVEAKIVPMAKLGKAFLWNGRYRSQGTTANDTADKIPTKILGIRCAKVNVEWNDGTISWEELRGPFGQKHYDMIPPEIIVYRYEVDI
ncbi:hypothetical protein ACHQM5_002215 [Ranunculus cassubicifolius]